MTKRLKFLLGNTPEEAEKVYNKYAKFLNKIATAYAKSTGLEKGDLFGEAVLGLSSALSSYDPKKGAITKWISFKVMDALNDYVANNSSLIRVPEYILLANKLVNRVRVTLELYTDNNELVNSIIYSGDLSKSELPEWVEDLVLPMIRTLHRSAARAGLTYQQLVQRANYTPEVGQITRDLCREEEEVEKRVLLRIQVRQLKEKMTEKEKKIANMIMDGKTYTQIAQAFNKTPGWVTEQLKKMKLKFKEEKLN